MGSEYFSSEFTLLNQLSYLPFQILNLEQMPQTKEGLEQELQAFKDANPNWMVDKADRDFVASYNNRLVAFTGKNSSHDARHATETLTITPFSVNLTIVFISSTHRYILPNDSLFSFFRFDCVSHGLSNYPNETQWEQWQQLHLHRWS